MTRRRYSLLLVPHGEGRTREWHFSTLGLRLLIGLLAVLSLAALVIVVLAIRIQLRYQDYLTLKERNEQLSLQLKKLRQVSADLERMRRQAERIRTMLGFEQEPPPLEIESLYNALAGESLADTTLFGLPDSMAHDLPRGSEPGRPSLPPLVNYTVSRGFSSTHLGVDLIAEAGTPVFATADGRVVFAGWDTIYGNAIRLKHRHGFQTFYGHLLRITRLRGDSVQQGQLIGLVGSTGRSTAPHLHYEVIRNRRQQDPELYFR
ncbi:MAG: peptidoglycan DD-metalloendopeptidase family protein [candidate division WOR-3 bacterium]